ncbi:MAG: amidohydrolase [Planctomycetota bacterium]|nr:MAG: amidohydrolase [Planctomycetota bacterium]
MLRRCNAECIFGIHICSNVPFGRIATRVGPFMASVNTFDITVRGQGGHAAMPETCRDPIVAAAQMVTAFQTIVSRSIPVSSPAVVSVTQFHAGTTDNVIPPSASLNGTIRTFDEHVRQTIRQRLAEIAERTAAAHGSVAEIAIREGYPVLVNDEAVTAAALKAARDIGFADDALGDLDPQGGGEDFAYYCRVVPGAFVFLGGRNETKDCIYPHHHPRFNIDEDALPQGSALHAQFALNAGGGS